MYNYFKQVVTFHKLEKVGNAIEVRHIKPSSLLMKLTVRHFLQYNYGNPRVWFVLVTFIYVDILGMSPPVTSERIELPYPAGNTG